jgi:hypothetical protein
MSNYRVIVRGVKPGRTIDEVVESLSKLSLKSPAVLREVLDGRRVIVKRTFEVKKAATYQRTLSKIGCVCTIEADDAVRSGGDTTAPAITVNVTSALENRAVLPSMGREFVYAKAPPLVGLRGTLQFIRMREFGLVVLLLVVLYYGYLEFSVRA